MSRAWGLAAVAAVAAFAATFGALELSKGKPAAPPPTVAPPARFLPRTRITCDQKIASLEAYNGPIYNGGLSTEKLLAFYEKSVGQKVSPEAWNEISAQMVGGVVPRVWLEASKRASGEPFISNRVMVGVLRDFYPSRFVDNGDALVFPESPRLRVVVSEPIQDYFRDSAWHWRWLRMYIDAADPASRAQLRELDVYAAEELSEFLSVLGVAVVQIASSQQPDKGTALTPEAVRAVFEEAAARPGAAPDTAAPGTGPGIFSADAKKKILASLQSPMFADATNWLGVTFRHAPDPKLRDLRVHLAVPVGLEGGGTAAGDFDGDGRPDIFFGGGGGGRLLRNVDGRGFEDVTTQAGLALEGESRAGYFVDYDNDGDLDLFVTFVYATNRLFRNDGNGRFTDVTQEIGLDSGKDVTHEAVWFDMDNDGLLDVYTAHFGNWPEGAVPTIGRQNSNGGRNRLYHHTQVGGKHRFEEIGHAAGVDDPAWTHCVGAWDFDHDGLPDLFSLNDFSVSHFFRNLGGGKFAEYSREAHLDITYNAMNFALVDVDEDGRFEVYVTEITKLVHRQRYPQPTDETPMVFGEQNLATMRILANNKCYRDPGRGRFEDVHQYLFEPADLGWSWYAGFADYENDGDRDGLVLNGTESNPPTSSDESRPEFVEGRRFVSQFGDQENVFFISEGGYFYDVSTSCPLAYKGNSRSAAFADFDGDGDLDVALNDYDAPARLYHNEQKTGNAWVRLRLVGRRSNRNAIGATIALTDSTGRTQNAMVTSTSGFFSQNPYPVHFGLGSANGVSKVVIRWPSGTIQTLGELPLNRENVVEEPE